MTVDRMDLIAAAPSTAGTTATSGDQSIITGPNARPILSVPKRCAEKSTNRMTTAMGIT